MTIKNGVVKMKMLLINIKILKNINTKILKNLL